ncbi:MAG: CDP-alcohol phosphatidyltransferase family protein [Bacteroidetes bacterium]|nr:CDP-alcohol phosphatidyltransferase family protein [Bacteroidota bacterium]
MKKHIPNLITLCNLMCGVFAVIIVISGVMPYTAAAILIFCGAICDFFDGFTARLLKVVSPIGKELDSFADLVTFGFAPAAMLSALIQHILFGGTFFEYYSGGAQLVWQEYVLIITPFIIVPFSALRLAKFNVDERQHHSFIGLPTPACALFFASLVFNPDALPPLLLAFLSIIFSLLLVAEIPMFSLKFKNFSWHDNKLRYMFLLLSLAAIIVFSLVAVVVFQLVALREIIVFQLAALPFIIIGYICTSLVVYAVSRKKKPLPTSPQGEEKEQKMM